MRHSKVVLFTVVLVCLGLAGSCKPPDLKSELVRATKGADLRGYTFTSGEDDSQATASFTSAAVKDRITLKSDGTVTTRYAAVHDKKNNTTTNYRNDIVRKGRKLTFVITDLGTNQVVDQQAFDVNQNGDDGTPPPPPPELPLCVNAERDYQTNQLPVLQREANRTCRIQRGGYSCCVTLNQNCRIVDTFVAPNGPIKCSFVNFQMVKELSLR